MRIGSDFYNNQYPRWEMKLRSGKISLRQFEDWSHFYKCYARREIIDYAPPTLSLTLSEVCNLRCPTCQLLPFRGTNHQAFMTLEFVHELFEKYPDSFSSIIIAGGEPLLNPAFPEIISFLKSLKREIKLYSNGILLARHVQHLKGIQKINISLDSFDQESFKKNRDGTSEQYKLIMEGLSRLKEENIPFQISYVLHQDNLEEAIYFLDFAGNISPASVKFHNINSYYSRQHNPVTLPEQRTRDFINRVMSRNDYSFNITMPTILDTDDIESQRVPCVQLWDGMRVGHDGSLAICCHSDNNPRYGNIFGQHPLNSPEFVDRRKLHIEGKLSNTICEFCPQRFFAEDYAFFQVKTGQWEVNHVYSRIEFHIP
jgi:molybdenum cofactor biosynthesis enzyme MoaA